MATDSRPPDLLTTVAGGERLRGVQRRADAAERGGVGTELAMFYGRAFENVLAALLGGVPAPGPHRRVLHEAVQGRAAFRGWQQAHTAADERAHLGQMAGHWEKIVAAVLAGEG